MQTHMIFEGENDSRVDYYVLAPGVSMLFNRIYTGTWSKGDMLNSDRILNLNFCIDGRCASISTIMNLQSALSLNLRRNMDFWKSCRLYVILILQQWR